MSQRRGLGKKTFLKIPNFHFRERHSDPWFYPPDHEQRGTLEAVRIKESAEGRWHPTAVLLPGKSHGRRSLVGCSPWGRYESDTTEWLHFHFSLSRIGEGNGNPLQCSCLENPRDGRAWWAAIYGVTQSRTRLKWLSSSSRRSKRKDAEQTRLIS